MATTVFEPRPGLEIPLILILVTIENCGDRASAGARNGSDRIKRLMTVIGRVDTRPLLTCIPQSICDGLGLSPVRSIRWTAQNGTTRHGVCYPAFVTIGDREVWTEVIGIEHLAQTVIGRIALLQTDYWIDVAQRKLAGNPEHDGQWMAELF